MSETNPLLKNIRESAGFRLAVLFGSFFVLLLLASLLSLAINNLSIGDEREHYLLSAVCQAIFAFCIPAFLLAKFSSNKPLEWLKLNTKSSVKPIIGVLLVYLLSLPAMEWLIEWNANLHLPTSLYSLENTLRNWEEANSAATNLMLNTQGIGNILIGFIVIGIITGFSEELFFRSGLQGILIRSDLNITFSIWIAAFIFSSMHFQFFGFVPRLVMGAFFGYLLVWTNDVKISAFAHILNNGIVVIVAGLHGIETSETSNSYLLPDLTWLQLSSFIFTVAFLLFFRGFFFKNHSFKNSISWRKSQLPPVTGR